MTGTGLIYSAKHTATGRRYIGQTSQTLRERQLGHFADVRHGSSTFFHRVLRKYGEDAFEWEILGEYGLDKLDLMERLWIDKLKTLNSDFGFNLTRGGLGTSGYKRSKESVARSAAKKRGQKRTPEQRERMRQAALRKPPASAKAKQNMKNSMTPERREAISKQHRKLWQDPEYRKRHVQKLKDYWATEEGKAQQLRASQLAREKAPNASSLGGQRQRSAAERARLSKLMTERWQDPEFRRKMLKRAS